MSLLSRIVIGLLLADSGVVSNSVQESGAEERLLLQADNTVIVNRDTYAASYLQYYLLKYLARHPDAALYQPEATVDRAAAPGFPIVREPPPDKHAITIGPCDAIPDTVLPPEDKARLRAARPGSVLLKRIGTGVVLARSSSNPWDFACLRIFLDRCAGIRMYAPDGADGLEWVSSPPAPTITVGSLDWLLQPHFAKTAFSTGHYQRNTPWLRMNSILSEGVDLRASHTVIRYFPPDKHYERYPQLYPMGKDGQRPKPIGDAWNPCLADPDLAAEVALEEIRGQMSGPRRPGYLSFGVMDCAYSCQCETCQASIRELGDGNAANLWYQFLNRVARQCQQEFPGLYLTSYAYSNVKLPRGMRLEPNIVIDATIKSYNVVDPASFAAQKDYLLALADVGARWVTHDWNFQGVTPRIYSRQLAAFLQWAAQHGMLGIYTEWSGGEHWYLSGAHYWVLCQLLSDPYQDSDQLWRQYCQDMFGAGWEPMYRFYDMFQQKHVVSAAFHRRDDWPRQEACAFDAADVAQQRGWLEEALRRTSGEPLIQKRLAAVRRYFRAHELLVQAVSVPGRLYHQHTVLNGRSDVNTAALAFYVNDDARGLVAFEDYYDTQRTIAPDSNAEDQASGIRFSYRNNYARALGTILQAVRQEALGGTDLQQATRDTVTGIVAKSRDVFRRHLPAAHDPQRTAEIEKLVAKVLWVPRGPSLPAFDGELDDAAWATAADLGDWTQADLMLPSREGNETTGKVFRVGDQLVFGLVCRQPQGIWAFTPPDRQTGTRIWREACCEFLFGPVPAPGDEPQVAQYIVNAYGAWRGFRQAADNRQGLCCAVKLAEDNRLFTVEAAFPLRVDGGYDFTPTRGLSFNVCRYPFSADTFNSKERLGWAPIFFSASYPESRGLIVLE
jgi:hypothetical protein